MRRTIIGALAAVLLGACGGVPTSLVLSLVAGEGTPAPDTVALRVYGTRVIAYDQPPFTVPAGDQRVLGTVVIYPPAGDVLALRVDAVGSTAGQPSSEGILTVILQRGRQTAAAITLAPQRLPDGDGDGVPDQIDNCPMAANPRQEDDDADGIGNGCTGDAGAPDGPPRPQAERCDRNEDCASGFCVDRVCCESACTGNCQACNLPGSAGTCAMVPDGQDPRDVCREQPPESCALDGLCDGAGACRRHRAGTVCRPPSCASRLDRVAATCDGNGTCQPPEQKPCAPYLCADGACRTTCATDEDCAPGNTCQAGACARKPLGAPCTDPGDCDSGHCVEKVCCDLAACAGACRSCAVPGSVGTCKPLRPTDPPRAPGCPTESAASCGQTGRCDGAGACEFYGSSTTCGSRTCTSGVETAPPTCDGKGSCGPGQTRLCAPYVCSRGTCGTSCTLDGDCVPDHYCVNKLCIPRTASGGACVKGNECASGFCTDGICCQIACPDGFYCPGGQCMPKKNLATACASGSECQTGFCADGRCCENACTGTCFRCNDPAALGRCQLIPDGEPDQTPACAACNGAGGCRTH
jgi:hypothetical protein